MTETAALIEQLADRAPAVRRLPPPPRRAARYLLAAFCILALSVVARGLRPDLAEQFMRPEVGLHWGAALVTGVLAALATFHVSVPGHSRLWALLPLPALVFWVAGLGWGCFSEMQRLGPAAMAVHTDWHCTAGILLTSLPLGGLLLHMVWYAGSVQPGATAFNGALAVAALSAAALTLCHEPDTVLMVLLWDFGTVALVVLGSWIWKGRLFASVGPRQPGIS